MSGIRALTTKPEQLALAFVSLYHDLGQGDYSLVANNGNSKSC